MSKQGPQIPRMTDEPLQISEAKLIQAFMLWRKPIEIAEADKAMASRRPVTLKMARKALLVSTQEMANRLGMSRPGYFKLEEEAELGRISIETLHQAAEALDCECFVCIRPKGGRTFISRIWNPLLKDASRLKWVHLSRPSQLGYALGAGLNQLFESPKFRRAQKWTRQHHRQVMPVDERNYDYWSFL